MSALPEVERGTALVLRTDGTEEVIAGKPNLARLREALECTTFDTVNIGRATGVDLVMLVDDNGYDTEAIQRPYGVELKPVAARKPVNEKATKLYHAICAPGTTHQIVGDVALVHDEDFA